METIVIDGWTLGIIIGLEAFQILTLVGIILAWAEERLSP
jgi:hypothetical protein